jgi:hypothetical protein
MYQRDNALTRGVDQPLVLDRPTLEILGPDAPELDEAIAPPITLSSRKARKRSPLEIGSKEPRIKHCAGITTLKPVLKGLEQPANNLDVLLRHRPRSISRHGWARLVCRR